MWLANFVGVSYVALVKPTTLTSIWTGEEDEEYIFFAAEAPFISSRYSGVQISTVVVSYWLLLATALGCRIIALLLPWSLGSGANQPVPLFGFFHVV